MNCHAPYSELLLLSVYNLISCKGHDRNMSRQHENGQSLGMEISANFITD